MRILFALPGFHRENRGAEVALLAVAEELAKTGDRVTVMGGGARRSNVSYDYIQIPMIGRQRCENFPLVPPFRTPEAWEDASFAWGLMRASDPADFDAAITCNFPFSHWALRRLGGRPRPLQIFVTQNGDWPASSNRAEFRLFRCDGLVCTNPDYEERNRGRWKTSLIPNGIDPSRFAGVTADRAAFGLPQERQIVLMVSALIDSKRVAEGIEAVALTDGAHLVVAGDGPFRAEVEALAARRLPGRFILLTVAPERMPALYASADAFLHMSLLESFGNVFVEAMASGLPIVGHDTKRLRWIVGDRDTLCDTENRAATVAALTRALMQGRSNFDPRAMEFTWPRIAAQYRTFLTALLAQRKDGH